MLRYWNCYPGARVDSDVPIYQLFDKELWEGWSFKERYPGWQELREYFQYLDGVLDLKKDIQFNTMCTGAKFDEQQNQWVIDLNNGTKVRARWFIPSLGFSAKPYIPPYRGIDKFKGEIHHTSVRYHYVPLLQYGQYLFHLHRLGRKQAWTLRTSVFPSSAPGPVAFKRSKKVLPMLSK